MKSKHELPIGLRFSLLHRTFRQKMDEQLSQHGLTGAQFCVLGLLKKLEDQGRTDISQRDLENASRVTHPTMTEIIKRLEKKGFIDCRPRPDDRRYKIISSTAMVRQLGEEVKKEFAKIYIGRLPEEKSSSSAHTVTVMGCLISFTKAEYSSVREMV